MLHVQVVPSELRPVRGLPGTGPSPEPSDSSLAGLQAALLDVPRLLLEGDDFGVAVVAALQRLAEAAGYQRAVLVRHEDDAGGPGTDWWRVLHEWHAPEVIAQSATADVRGRTADAAVWSARLFAGEPVLESPTATLPDPGLRLVQEAVGARALLSANVLLDGRSWGALSFDDCRTDRPRTAAERAALASAAHVIGLAVARQAMRERALAAERAQRDAEAGALAARAREAERLATLLEGVVTASRALLDATDLHTGLVRWLPVVMHAVGADRAGLGVLEPDPDGTTTADGVALPRARTLLDATGPGLASIADVVVPMTPDFTAWTVRLLRGETIWATRDDLSDHGSRAYWDATGCACNLIVPVVVDGATWGWLYLDFTEARPYRATDTAVLRTAADGVAAAVRRERLLEAARDARAAAARERTRALEAHNAVLVHRATLLQAITEISQELIRVPDPTRSFGEVARRLGEASGCDRVCLMAFEPPDADSARGYVAMRAEWTAPGIIRQTDTPERRINVDELGPLLDEWIGGRFVLPTRDLPEPFRSGQASLGVRTQAAIPIWSAGASPWGFIGCDDCTTEREWDVSQLAALQVAAALLGTALERWAADRARAQAEADRQAAVIAAATAHAQAAEARLAAAEARTRLAQDLHDSVSQHLVSICLQLETARRAGMPAARRAALVAAYTAAKHGVAATRRTLTTLREGARDEPPPTPGSPHDTSALPHGASSQLPDGHVPGDALVRALRQLVRRLRPLRAGAGPRVRVVGGTLPPFDPQVASALLRIAESALANALLHAGAHHVHLRLHATEARTAPVVRLVVEDDGCGFDPACVPPDRFGLVGMREQAAAIGAHCDVHSAAAQGTRVEIRWSGPR